MPFSSRVGVIPHNSNSKSDKSGGGGSSSRRKQGITMEDLKKQTAIRLAQEQQRSRIFGGLPQRKDRNLQGVPEQQQVQVTSPTPYFHGQRQPPPSPSPQNLVTYNNANQLDAYHYEDPAVAAAAAVANQQRAYARSASAASGSPAASKNSYSSPSPKPNDNNRSAFQPNNQHQQAKSKLPHGLTVQELKEMTKARLKAEAQEVDNKALSQNQQSPFHPQDRPPRTINTTPIEQQQQQQMSPFQNYQEPPRQAVGRGYGTTSGASTPVTVPPTGGPPGFPSVPSTNSLASDLGLQNQGWQQTQQTQPTPPPPQPPKMEAWETGSAVSINSSNIGSEYLGSESAYTDEFSEIPFNRNRSFPVGGGYEPGYFDMTMTPNRRRACTLSPRVGLSHLHEDRPMFEGGSTELKIPSFESGVRVNLGMRVIGDDGANRPRTYSGGNVAPAFNRPRTASAPTVPFHHDDLFENSMSESHDVLPNSVVESVLGGSASSGDNYSSVFRSSGEDDFGAALLHGGAAPPTTPAAKSSFNWGNFSNDDDGASLAKDLGTMLNLSGIHDSEHHESSLASRMDQETSLFPSISGNGGRAAGSSIFGQDPSYFDHRDGAHDAPSSH